MSHHYSINTLLKIQDPNISFSDIPWEENIVEGFHQKIKLMKRISYGYKSFQNLRRRILICSPNNILKVGEI